jgi:hypothetical protein
MVLCPATPADVGLLRHWGAQPHVRASDSNDDWAWEVELANDPNVQSHRFYEWLVFQFVERRWFGQGDCFLTLCLCEDLEVLALHDIVVIH